ncbi:hypothetical protein H704_00341 [Bartonella bacilliformis Peru38]|uniref:Ancillary SecYEG translocon subunit n=2 Tax=Bartonella bacilliformis TaxID=774 RepID=A1URT9_BARBK|nr:tetratricopeptide repeat protein [Bartonella bacilliformis]ABM44809.1 conserved hypothetical protein [Bartonella bacilliformis KC583]AMG85537.1 hypothetical protein AL467_01830 [Bartonella bacilliformis]EKS44945.1 hypothetical protein BbINS_01734 [Bartonella bacilliformis INS]EYS90173.1 hypothetical protein X472_00629 [Bartonella bacilliformis San Pedro600-02]EYS94923.1 hypothetical protein X470_00433 [Bartonella bacilliformis Peru-18]
MSYDSFIHEVNEEFRQEKVYAFLKRHGFLVIVAAIIFILAIVGYQVYSHKKMNEARNIGDIFIKSLSLADSHDFDQAMNQLELVKASNFAGYPFLARLREASLLSEQGDAVRAVEMFDTVAFDEKAPQILQKVAKIQAAYILVDIGTLDDVKKRVQDIANDIDPMRISAREALGLAAYKADKMDEAVYYFQKISEEGNLGIKIVERAKIMLELIQAEGKVNKE